MRFLKQSHIQVKTDFNAFPEILEWFEQFSDGLISTLIMFIVSTANPEHGDSLSWRLPLTAHLPIFGSRCHSQLGRTPMKRYTCGHK